MRKILLIMLAGILSLPVSAEFRLVRRGSLHELDNATIYSVVSDASDALWINSSNGLLRYNGSFLSGFGGPLPMHDLHFDGEDRLYALGQSCILTFDTNTLEAGAIDFPADGSDGTVSMCAGAEGLWFARGTVLWHCPKGESELRQLARMDSDIDALLRDAEGGIWIAAGRQIHIYKEELTGPVLSLKSEARRLYLGSDGVLWVGYKSGGVAAYDREFKLVREYHLRGNNFRTFCEGDDGIYIGNESEIIHIDSTGTVWVPPVGRIEHQPVTSICRSRNGFLWAGTFYSGIYRIMSNDGALQNLHYPDELLNFRAIVRSQGDDMVLLTDGNGAWLYNNKVGFRFIAHSGNLKFQCGVYIPEERQFLAGLHSGDIVALLPSQGYRVARSVLSDHGGLTSINDIRYRGGKLWCATNDGIILFERDTRGWKSARHFAEGLAFYSIGFDGDGLLWAAGNGLHAFNPDTSEDRLVMEGRYTNVYCDGGCVWAAEFGKGAWQLSGGDARLWNEESCGLEDNSITSICAVADGSILLTTRSGFSVLDTDKGSCRNFNTENGLEMSSGRNGSVISMEDGRFLICGLDGAAFLNPARLIPDAAVSVPVVDFILLQNRSIHVTGEKPVVLGHRDNMLQLEFSNYDYKDEANGSFEYSFSASRNNWQKANLYNPMSLVNLQPGHYTLRSRYPGSEDIRTFRFRIRPPWFASPLAIFAYLLLLLFTGWHISRMQYARKLLSQRLIEKEAENEKWQKLLLKLSHELRTPMSTIIGNLEIFLGQYGKKSEGVRYLHKAWNGTADMEKTLSKLLEIEDTDLIKFDDLPSYGAVAPVQFIPKAHTMLIADDNPDILAMLEDIFSEEYTLQVARDGTEAFEKAVKSQPDIIISDVMMPGMDGIALCAALRGEYMTRHIPIILLTAHASDRNLIEGLDAGADDYVAKPFSVEILRAKCRRLILTRETLKDRVKPDVKSKPTPFLNAAISVVEHHLYDEDLSVGTLCRELGVSKTTLNRRLAELSGMSPRDFIEDIKLKYAATMLLKENSRISEIADRLHFSSQKYFTQRFKKKFGKTPSAHIKGQG